MERLFPEGLDIPVGPEGRKRILSIISCNSDRRVTWIVSYVSADASVMYCVYEAPTPESIRLTARNSGLPVDRITEISTLEPFAFDGRQRRLDPEPR